jgi:hypothetical protein
MTAKTAKAPKKAELRDALREDKTFAKYRRIVKMVREALDLEALEQEVMRLHVGRESRTLDGTVPSPDKVYAANQQDAKYRSRMAEIRVQLFKQSGALAKATKEVRLYLADEYGSYVSGRTVAERNTYFNRYMNTAIALTEDIDNLMERIDFLIKDIDQMGFTLRRSIDVLELIYGKNSDRHV